jgi:hypothetical protein
MTAILRVVIIGGLLLLPLSGAGVLAAGDDQYRIVKTGQSTFEQELNRTASEGYQLVAGDPAREMAIFVRSSDRMRRSYRFAASVEKLLKNGGVPAGFRLIPQTFSADVVYSAIFENIEGDVQSREYRLLEAGSPGALVKKLEKGEIEPGFGVVAVAADPYGAAAISERQPEPKRTTLIASSNPDDVRNSLSSTMTRERCLIHGDATKDVLYLLQECAPAAGRTYELIASTVSGKLEQQMNAAAARGLRLVPSSVVSKSKTFLGNYVNAETVAVMESGLPGVQVTYRVLATVRLSTLAEEIAAAARDGYSLVSYAAGPKELYAVLEKR